MKKCHSLLTVASGDSGFYDKPAAVTSSSDVGTSAASSARRTPENFLGENKNLVNLDNLLGVSSTNPAYANPFLIGCTTASNPFASQQRKSPTLNEMRAAQGSTVPPIPQIGPRVETLPKSIPTLHDPNPFFS
ncbi:unnamed protein product [Haemonchus placei]|uniref:SOSS complex subunit C homolog n=1 Tax=Haemonchus placei TaxID=6290 RepID=A0A0N4VS41_HAEPC|nr:unnamed protein product [Haemonchus placei]